MKSTVVKVKDIIDPLKSGNEIVELINNKIILKKHSVGLLFCSSTIDATDIVKVIDEKLGIPVIGCTSSGEIGNDGYSDDSAVFMVMTSDDNIFHHGIIENIINSSKEELEKNIAENYSIAKKQYFNEEPSIMFIFPHFKGLNSIATIFNILNESYRELSVFGGGSAVDFGDVRQEFNEFYNGKVYKGAMPYLFIKTEDKPIIAYENIVNIDREIVGKITDYELNVIKTIDNEPACEFLMRTLGYEVSKKDVFFLHPSMIFSEGYKYSRVIIDIDRENGYLILGGSIENGGEISLQVVMSDFIERSTRKAVEDAMNRKSAGMNTVLCVSCECRKLINIFEKEQEAKILNEYMDDDMNLIGFYSYGEITPLLKENGERYNFYNNETISICIL